MSEFYSAGGTTQFQDRVAASLGIKAANVKIVSVYQGSLVLKVAITEDKTNTIKSKGGLDQVL